MLFRKEEKAPHEFWQEYEEETGEKVISRGLGKYISGWVKFDEKNWGGIWGLVITTSGGFRFHHFPQHSWIDSLSSFAKSENKKEKTIFIPNEKIISLKHLKETKWWRKIFFPSPPRIVIQYLDDTDTEKSLIFEAEFGEITG